MVPSWLLATYGPHNKRISFLLSFQNASTHGPPTSSAVLANLGDFLCGITCETSEKRDQLGSGK